VELNSTKSKDLPSVRYGLAAIKNVGFTAMRSLISDRNNYGEFKDINDFFARLDTRLINKRQLENLVKAGTLDQMHPNRRQLAEAIETLIKYGDLSKQEKQSAQIGLFAGEEIIQQNMVLPDCSDWNMMERLKEEFDAIGFYLSAHPLDSYRKHLEHLNVSTYEELLKKRRSGIVVLAGVIIGKKDRLSQKGNRFSFLQLSDQSGAFEIIIFSELLTKRSHFLVPGKTISVKATAQFEGESIRLTAHDIQDLEHTNLSLSKGLKIILKKLDNLSSIKMLLRDSGVGKGEVVLVTRTKESLEVEVRLQEKYNVSSLLAKSVEAIPGVAEVIEY